jgi:hypothetical protein
VFKELFVLPEEEWTRILSDDVNLLQFSFRYLKQVLFGENTIPLNDEIAKERREKTQKRQEELEKERTVLEEARRRRSEYHNGREEMLQHLTRGIGLLEESEFNARRDAEQMSRTLGDLREHLVKVQTLNDQTWTQENYSVELTRALTTLENARMEWNAAQLKWSILTGAASGPTPKPDAAPGAKALAELDFGALCRLGLALNWPIALMALAGLVLLALALFAR